METKPDGITIIEGVWFEGGYTGLNAEDKIEEKEEHKDDKNK